LHAACFMPVSSLPHFGHKDGGDTFFQNISWLSTCSSKTSADFQHVPPKHRLTFNRLQQHYIPEDRTLHKYPVTISNSVSKKKFEIWGSHSSDYKEYLSSEMLHCVTR
jgi:hypothetical protein